MNLIPLFQVVPYDQICREDESALESGLRILFVYKDCPKHVLALLKHATLWLNMTLPD